MPAAGSKEFISDLLVKNFASPEGQIDILKGCDISGHALSLNGFTRPILVPDKQGLRIQVPSSFTPSDLLLHVGPDFLVDIIDVRMQSEIQMPLREFIDHFNANPRLLLLNMLSLEFSQTNLSKLVQPPHVVSELSLISNCWVPDVVYDDLDDDSTNSSPSIPSVQKYCLLSMAGSYTDFHIDFGGSSVWYHVIWGEKIFYLIPPTPENIAVYWQWFWDEDHQNVFLPDLLPSKSFPTSDPSKNTSSVYRLHLTAGQTVLLPSGWIHAVYTISDCLVFGGNFLTELHIPTQLRVYRMEQRSGTPRKFQFPNFEKVHWFVADRIAGRLTNALHDHREVYHHEVEAVQCLAHILPHWFEQRRSLPVEDRLYYLPSRAIMELSWSQLIVRLQQLVDRLSRSSRKTAKRRTLDAHLMLNSDPHENDSLVDPSTGNTYLKSSPKRDLVRRGKNKLSHTVADASVRNHRTSPSNKEDLEELPVTSDPDILEALPELNDSRLIGDHLYFDLSDSDDEPKSKRGRQSRTFSRAQSHGNRESDPTWSVSSPTRKKSGPWAKRTINLLTPSKCQVLPTPCLTGSELHPLLRDASTSDPGTNQSKPVSATVLSNTSKATLSSSKTAPKSTSSRSKSSLTGRQRLAKKLGL